MAELKFSQLNTLTAHRDENLVALSYWDGISAFTESQFLTWGALKTELQAQIDTNLGNTNQTLTGARGVAMGTSKLTFSSTGQANMLVFDNVNNRIGFGLSTPTVDYDFNGGLKVDAFIANQMFIDDTKNFTAIGTATQSSTENFLVQGIGRFSNALGINANAGTQYALNISTISTSRETTAKFASGNNNVSVARTVQVSGSSHASNNSVYGIHVNDVNGGNNNIPVYGVKSEARANSVTATSSQKHYGLYGDAITQNVGIDSDMYGVYGRVRGLVANSGTGKWRAGVFELDLTNYNGSDAASIELIHPTETTLFVDSGSTGATEQDWVEVKVGGTTGYIRVYATK